MNKTFKEVIADIKSGEVWESLEENQRVQVIELCPIMGTVVFKGDVSCAFNDILCAVNPKSKFRLKRKEYSFQEAFTAYEEGKEIESIEDGVKYRIKNGVEEYYYDSAVGWFETGGYYQFTSQGIRGKWYIND